MGITLVGSAHCTWHTYNKDVEGQGWIEKEREKKQHRGSNRERGRSHQHVKTIAQLTFKTVLTFRQKEKLLYIICFFYGISSNKKRYIEHMPIEDGWFLDTLGGVEHLNSSHIYCI